MHSVLIADNSYLMRSNIRKILEKEGYMVVGEADNGITCIEKFKEYRPEMVTLEVALPELDGITTLKMLMKMKPDAKIIMISALGRESLIKEAISAGAKAFIIKPFKKEYAVSVFKKTMSAE